ncbi:hypothetical protein CPB85DRAFT_1345046 [Mucidula mucida]|nr:hypothetical protein CPB85DRAFT_1345046 [Mucidula mucida]
MWWYKPTALLSYIDRLRPKYFSLTLKTVDTILPGSITHLSDVVFHTYNSPVADRLLPQSYEVLWRNVFARCPFLTHIMIGFYIVDPPPWASHKTTFVQSVLSNAPLTFTALIIDVSDFGACLDDPRFIIVSPEPWHPDVEGVARYPTGPGWDHWVYMRGKEIWEFADAQLRERASRRLATLPGS